MSDNKYFEAFGKPFIASDVSWRLQYVDKEKCEGFAVPYLDARAIADRLDSVVGQNRWKDVYTPWHGCVVDKSQKNSQLCTIFIYDEGLQEWIGKTDGAEDTDIEPIKGGLSDAFKRAAVKWNIGRYLYGFQPVWVKAKKRSSSFVIDDSEKNKLETAYNNTVKNMFGIQPQTTSGNNSSNQPQESPKPASNSAPGQHPNGADPVYEIKNLRVENGKDGGEYSRMILYTGKETSQAFMNGRDERLKIGAKIKILKGEDRSNSYGKYIMLNEFDLAA